MMLRISNNGEVETGAFTLLGASTKDGQDKIGFFGSGNKYAMATLLRNSIGFRIFSGDREVVIDTKKAQFGGCEYDQIYIDGQPTSFTTRMGPAWEVWFALREFVCNAIDEGGYSIDTTSDDPIGQQGKSTIYIEMAEPVIHFYDNIDEYILQESESGSAPMQFTVYGDVTPYYHKNQEMTYTIYRKGIRASAVSDARKSLFRWNFDRIDINESRIVTYEYQVSERIASYLLICDSPEILKKYIEGANDSSFFEYNLMWDYAIGTPSETWRNVVGDTEVVPRSVASMSIRTDLRHSIVLPNKLCDALHKAFPEMRVVGYGMEDWEEVNDVPQHLMDNLKRAIEECEEYGHSMLNYSYKVVNFIKEGLVAATDRINSRVLFGLKYLDDYDYLVSTVFEETAHIRGYLDGSRDFEQYLMTRIIDAERRARAKEA